MCAIPQLVSAALLACENIRFSSLFAAGDVSLFFGGREATTGNASALRRLRNEMRESEYHYG